MMSLQRIKTSNKKKILEHTLLEKTVFQTTFNENEKLPKKNIGPQVIPIWDLLAGLNFF